MTVILSLQLFFFTCLINLSVAVYFPDHTLNIHTNQEIPDKLLITLVECTFPMVLNPNCKCPDLARSDEPAFVKVLFEEILGKGSPILPIWFPPTLVQAGMMVVDRRPPLPSFWLDYPFETKYSVDFPKPDTCTKNDREAYDIAYKYWSTNMQALLTLYRQTGVYLIEKHNEWSSIEALTLKVLTDYKKVDKRFVDVLNYVREAIYMEDKHHQVQKITVWHTGKDGDKLEAFYRGKMSSFSLGMSLFAACNGGDSGACSICLFASSSSSSSSSRSIYAFPTVISDFFPDTGCLYTSTLPAIMDMHGVGELFHGRMRYSLAEKQTYGLDGINGGFGAFTEAASSPLTEENLGRLWLAIRANVEIIVNPDPWEDHTGLLELNQHNKLNQFKSKKRMRGAHSLRASHIH